MFDQLDDRAVTLPIGTAERGRSARTADRPTDQAQPDDGAGLTVAAFARRYRIGEGKVLGWIRSGELRAINTASSLAGRPRWLIPPEAITAFEAKRAGGPSPATAKQRRRRTSGIDFFPD
jgi:hypothetical protein